MWNKEQLELVDEAYDNYCVKYLELDYLQDKIFNGDSYYDHDVEDYNFEEYSKEEFIEKCETDIEFSQNWELKIDERELSLEERTKILVCGSDNKKDFYDRNGRLKFIEESVLNDSKIPNKIITMSYKNKIIESYE